MSETLVNLEINGTPVAVRRGATIIEAADAAGIRIPRFCYHKKLSIAANCRMCLVEVEKGPKPVAACAFPVMEGMKVYTQSAKALEAQRGTMEFLLINHPLDCPICDQGGECELQDSAMGYGHDVSRYNERKRVVKDKDIGPLVSTDMTRCIHCTRCVRFGTEIAGLRELGATGRGEFMKIGTFVEKSLNSELSGNIIDLCPVGALNAKPSRMAARAWEMSQHATVAPHDAVGSHLYLHVLRGRVIRAVPRECEDINETWLSDRDRFSYQALAHEDRLLAPVAVLHKDSRTLEWSEALDILAKNLKQYAPEDIGAWVSPGATVEELYLLQKLLRGLGCNNIDHRLRQSDFEHDQDAPLFPWLGMAHAELETLDAALLVGCDIRREQPLAGLRLRKAALRGATVMALNPRDFEFTFPLSAQMLCDPIAMTHKLAGIARAMFDLKGKDVPDSLFLLRGIDKACDEELRCAKRLFDAKNAALILGAVAINSPQFSVFRGLANLIFELCGARPCYLPEAANSAGAWLAGAIPHREPAGLAANQSGKHFQAMLEQPAKLLLLWNVEPEFDCADPSAAMKAVEAADCVINFSSFASANAYAYSDYLLPVASFAETDGTLVNSEGRWQSFEAAVSPPGEAKPGWKILRALGEKLGLDGFSQTRSIEVRDELTALVPKTMKLDNRSPVSESLRLPKRMDGVYRSSSVGIYSGDGTVRRASALQATLEARTAGRISLCREQAQGLNLQDASEALVRQGGYEAVLPVHLDEGVPMGSAYFSSGTEASASLGPAFGPVELLPVVQG